MSKGNNPNALADVPTFSPAQPFQAPAHRLRVSGDVTLRQSMTVDGVLPETVPNGASMQITAVLPTGGVQPLVWLYEYRDTYRHPFLFRRPLELPSGTVIRGVRPPASVFLLPVNPDGAR